MSYSNSNVCRCHWIAQSNHEQSVRHTARTLSCTHTEHQFTKEKRQELRWRQNAEEHWSETNCLANIRFYNVQFSHFIAKIFISINLREQTLARILMKANRKMKRMESEKKICEYTNNNVEVPIESSCQRGERERTNGMNDFCFLAAFFGSILLLCACVCVEWS